MPDEQPLLSKEDNDWLTGYIHYLDAIIIFVNRVFDQYKVKYLLSRLDGHLDSSRVKAPDSTTEKYNRKKRLGAVYEDILPGMTEFQAAVRSFGDMIGYRVIVPNLSRAELVVEELIEYLSSTDGFQLKGNPDYKGCRVELLESCVCTNADHPNCKPGYKAIHLQFEVTPSQLGDGKVEWREHFPAINTSQPVEIEVQIQTVIQSAFYWIDHEYCYKPPKNEIPADQMLKRINKMETCGQCINHIDLRIDSVTRENAIVSQAGYAVD